ncbi:DNA polymerase III epsilon subunit-like protein [Salinibacter ruber]|jgi:DNA polymerase III epsilon subunit-like protein|nr:DNA polymerase III epsilon subunit-like protein [Salinibacter ruber]
MAVVDQNGIRFDWCSDGASPRDDAVSRQLPLLVGHLESGIVVGHNLQFDFRFLTYEAERLALGGLDLRFADTSGLARSLFNVPDTYQLKDLLSHFGAAQRKTLHRATGDALATRTLFWHLVEHDSLQTLSDARVQRLQ